jgi:outer membrane protein TolC
VLLGQPPGPLTDLIAKTQIIPAPPPRLAVGIPADLLRRRPDIRSAEYQAAAQCAKIGVAQAELFPAFSLSGTFGYLSSNTGNFSLGEVIQGSSLNVVGGPAVRWKILNYGRLANLVRVQDARFQELLLAYQNAVLKAQQEVEDNLIAFLRTLEKGVWGCGFF